MVYCSIFVKILANTQSICCVFALIEQKPSLCKIFDLKARRFWMIFVLLGRRNALCLTRHNRAKSAEIRRFKAGSDLSLYPIAILLFIIAFFGLACKQIYEILQELLQDIPYPGCLFLLLYIKFCRIMTVSYIHGGYYDSRCCF